MKRILAALPLLLALFLASPGASAEKADALKQATVQFDDAHIDQATQTRTLVGKVVLTRGTLTVTYLPTRKNAAAAPAPAAR
jgi:lipopolysaccharide export system protein LptA